MRLQVAAIFRVEPDAIAMRFLRHLVTAVAYVAIGRRTYTSRNIIIIAYRLALRREADPPGLNIYAGRLDRGEDLEEILREIFESREAGEKFDEEVNRRIRASGRIIF